jgi:hypothetical protein
MDAQASLGQAECTKMIILLPMKRYMTLTCYRVVGDDEDIYCFETFSTQGILIQFTEARNNFHYPIQLTEIALLEADFQNTSLYSRRKKFRPTSISELFLPSYFSLSLHLRLGQLCIPVRGSTC